MILTKHSFILSSMPAYLLMLSLYQKEISLDSMFVPIVSNFWKTFQNITIFMLLQLQQKIMLNLLLSIWTKKKGQFKEFFIEKTVFKQSMDSKSKISESSKIVVLKILFWSTIWFIHLVFNWIMAFQSLSLFLTKTIKS